MKDSNHADKKLAIRLSRGDDRAFKLFFDRYFDRLYRFTIARIGREGDAVQDIVQQTMTRALKNIASYRGEAALLTWLYRICRNQISDYLRAHQKTASKMASLDDELMGSLLDLISDETGDPDQLYQRSQVIESVQHVLDFLPSSYGDVLEWKYILGFSVEEIADRLAVTQIAAQSILARARTAFRAAFPQLIRELALDQSDR